MADLFLVFAHAYALEQAQAEPYINPVVAGGRVGFLAYDNGFNLWPEASCRVVLGFAVCRNVYGDRLITRDSRKAAEFIHAC